MTTNIDPRLSAWLALREDLRTYEEADRMAPVLVRMRDGSGLLELRNDVPVDRAHCPTRRSASGHVLCGHVKCTMHLWRIDSVDRPGRRYANAADSTTLRAGWREDPAPACCAHELAERGGMEATEIAKEMQCHPSLIRWIVRRVGPKLKGIKGLSGDE